MKAQDLWFVEDLIRDAKATLEANEDDGQK